MINLEAVRASGSRPRVHGNGFIQLDLTKDSRLHIWGDLRIPRQNVATPIHDHKFGFISKIIVGRLINVVYHLEPAVAGDFRVYEAQTRDGEDTILNPTRETVVIEPVHMEVMNWNSMGRSYEMAPLQFHETFAPDGPAATIMTKQERGNSNPRVLVPVDKQPDNHFNRYDHDEDNLWRIIKETLRLRK